MKKFIGLLVLILMAGVGYYGYVNYWPSDEIAVFNPQNRQMVYMEGIPQTQQGIFIEEQGELLLKATYLENHADAHLFWDSNEETLVITTFDSIFRFQPESNFYMENDQPVDLTVPLQLVNNEPYLPMSFISPFLTADWIYRDQDQTLIMEEQRECRLIAEIIVEGAIIRQDPSIKAPRFDMTLVPGDTLTVYETHEKWLKIRTEDGLIGFIHKKEVKRYEECRPSQRPASEIIIGWKPGRGN